MTHQNGHSPALRVLIVEDNDAQRRILLDMIRTEGFQAQAYATPEEALAQVAKEKFPVAIIDHRLPGMTGTALLEHMATLQPDVRAIIHTGFGSFESAKEAVNLGAFAYVEKLGEPEELLRHVHRAAQDWMGEALQRSQENYRHLIESVQAVVWRGDPDTMHITFVSREAEAMLGYEMEEWLKPDFWMVRIHPDDRAATLDLCADAIQEGRAHTLEYRMVAADGRIVWVRDMVNVVVEDGQPKELVGVMVDITDRKRMEESLRQRDAVLFAVSFATEELLRSDSLEGGLETVLAHLGQSTEASRVSIFENQTRPDGQVAARPFAEWAAPGIPSLRKPPSLHTSYHEAGVGRWYPLLKRGDSISGPIHTFPDEEQPVLEARHLRSLAVVPIFVNEAFWGFMGFDDCETERVWSDIVMEALRTAANILGAAIEQQQAAHEIQLLAQAVRSAREAVCITDLDDVIIFVNQAFQEIYGYREDELLGQPVTMVRAVEHPPGEDPLRLPSDQRDTWQGELWNQRKDGTVFPVLLSTSVVRNEAGEPVAYVGVAQDFTERKKAEEALQVSQARLAQAQRIARLGYWEWDLATDTYVWSDETYRLLDLEPQSVEPDEELFLEYVHPDDQAALRSHTEARLAGKDEVFLEYRILLANGDVRWVWTESIVYRDELGQPVRMIGAIQDITERKEADARLRYLAIVLSNVSDAIISTDLDFRIRSWNAAAEALYGWSEADVLGRSILDIIPPTYVDETTNKEAIKALMTSGRWGGEVVQYHRDGTRLHVLSSVALVRDADGRPVGVVAANRDISERKQMEEALRASEEKFAKAFQSSPDSITLSRLRDGVFLEVNEGFERINGYSRAEALGEQSQNLRIWEPGSRERMIAMLEMEGTVRGMEFVIRRKDGERRHGLLSAEVIELEGEPCLVAITRDITERKQAEEALRKSEISFRLMFEHNPIPMWVFDRETLKFLDVNDAAIARYGYTREEFLSMTISDIRPEDDEPRLHTFLNKGVTSLSDALEWQHQTKDGTLLDVEVTTHAFPYRDRPARLVLANDITERKRLQKEILEISNREQRRIGSDLHDGLGQLLTGIGFRVEALEGDLRDEGRALAEDTVEIGELVEMAVAQSRALARGLNPVNVEQQGLAAALHELTQSVQSIYGLSCTFTCPRPIKVSDLEVATHLYRIAQEAVNNAVKHAQASRIAVSLDVREELATLRVEDDGVGITTSPAHEAEGMGLRIMNYRSNMIGGLFSVSPSRTGGTVVACQFPLSSLHQPAA